MAKRFVIGDVHGCFYTLKALIENQLRPTPEDHIYFLGDYIDRGNNSKAVLDYCLDLIQAGFQLTLLRGNHEQMLLDSFHNDQLKEVWLAKNGGLATLKSFNAHSISDIPSTYIDLMSKMPYYIELEHFILVHAGLNLTLDNPFSDTDFMLWTRKTPHYPHKIQNKRIIHGHTPLSLDEIKKNIENHSFLLNIDGGCVWIEREGCGNLCALELNSQQLFVEPNSDR